MMRERPPTAWPPNWRADARYERLYDMLHNLHGQVRVSHIVRGLDQETNADLTAWRRLGEK